MIIKNGETSVHSPATSPRRSGNIAGISPNQLPGFDIDGIHSDGIGWGLGRENYAANDKGSRFDRRQARIELSNPSDSKLRCVCGSNLIKRCVTATIKRTRVSQPLVRFASRREYSFTIDLNVQLCSGGAQACQAGTMEL